MGVSVMRVPLVWQVLKRHQKGNHNLKATWEVQIEKQNRPTMLVSDPKLSHLTMANFSHFVGASLWLVFLWVTRVGSKRFGELSFAKPRGNMKTYFQ